MSGIPSNMEEARSRRFELVGRLGQGGGGIVYEALDRQRGTRVALKALRHLGGEAVLQFKREFRQLQDLHHPNLISLGELVEEEGAWYFTMELVRGSDLLCHVRSGPAGLQEARLREALGQLALGLHALHRAGKVHRDIKPSNILVSESGRTVLLDFGILSDAGPGEEEEGIAGTAAYMAPEQALGAPPAPSADWYSVGVVLYQALTGRLPFTGRAHEVLALKQQETPRPPQAWGAGLPEDLCRLCEELLSREPRQRPSGEQVLHRLGVAAGAQQGEWGAACLPFTGRRAELAALHHALAEGRQGASRAVLLQGESGVGKTRLLHQFLVEVAARLPEALVLSGRCYERESVPYKGVDGLLSGLVRYLTGPGRAEVAAVWPSQPGPLVRLFPLLQRVQGGPAARALVPEPQEPLALRVAAFAALRELLGRLAARRPVVLGVDDLQWVDRDGAALLDELMRAPGVLLVGCVRVGSEPRRSPEAEERRFWREARWLLVECLPEVDTQALLQSLLRQATPEQLSHLAAESGGLPLFIDTLARTYEGQEPQATAGRLEEALWARLRRLEPSARNLLTLLCLAGQPLPHAVAAHALALELPEYGRLCSSLRTAHLVHTSGLEASGTLELAHDRLRGVVVPRLEPLQRRSWHARLALSLEALQQGAPEVLARHWHEAGHGETALSYYLRAAAEAAQALAFAHEARLYQAALAVVPAGGEQCRRLQVCLGEALARAGRGAEAARAFLAAAQGAEPAEAVRLERRAAGQYLACGLMEEGLAMVRRVLAAAGLSYPETRQQALLGLAWQRLQLALRPVRLRSPAPEPVPAQVREQLEVCSLIAFGLGPVEPLRAYAFQARYLLLALRSGERQHLCRALCAEVGGQALSNPGHRRAERWQRLLESLAQELGEDMALQSLVHATLAWKACMRGEFASARPPFERSLELLQRARGASWEQVTAWSAGVWLLASLGEVAELGRRLVLPLGEARERGDLNGVTTLRLSGSVYVRLAEGDVRGARAEADEALARWGRPGFDVQHFRHLRLQLEADLYERQGARALQRLEEAQPWLERASLQRFAPLRAPLLDVRARACLQQVAEGGPQAEVPWRAAEREAHRLARQGLASVAAQAELILAGVAAARGHGEQALERYGRAAQALEQVGLRVYAAAARMRRGELLGGEEGRALVDSARVWMRNQGIVSPEAMGAALAPPCAPAAQPAALSRAASCTQRVNCSGWMSSSESTLTWSMSPRPTSAPWESLSCMRSL